MCHHMKTWSALQFNERVVVVPTTDSDYHGEENDLDTDECHCNPEVKKDDLDTKKIVIHNAWDGREWEEFGR